MPNWRLNAQVKWLWLLKTGSERNFSQIHIRIHDQFERSPQPQFIAACMQRHFPMPSE